MIGKAAKATAQIWRCRADLPLLHLPTLIHLTVSDVFPLHGRQVFGFKHETARSFHSARLPFPPVVFPHHHFPWRVRFSSLVRPPHAPTVPPLAATTSCFLRRKHEPRRTNPRGSRGQRPMAWSTGADLHPGVDRLAVSGTGSVVFNSGAIEMADFELTRPFVL